MNAKMLQIRWHGRGGQGAKTAASMLAEAAIGAGRYAQAAPEYGAERQGAPVRAYTRIHARPIRAHDAIYHPDVVTVLDEGLLNSEDVAAGLSEDGVLLVNTKRSPEAIREQLSSEDMRVYTVDATGIALAETDRPIPNMVMLGALLRVKDVLAVEDIEKNIRQKLEKKLGEELIDKNMNAVRRAFQEVDEEP
jgi:pyruvate ferredoxin oxidoreductase gamma subunit